MPKAPSYLGRDGKGLWTRHVKILARLGVLGRLDLPLFTLLCGSWDQYCEARRIVARDGAVVKGRDGRLAMHPAQRIKAQAADQVLVLLREFGMTPIARARLGVDDRCESEPDPFERFRARDPV
jgi:P27 family predicted phage terminase small subunit